ncbi:MAG: hypothetical protein JST59_01405 [Actinobacteria bacterium]|nr:hypothetical protein [Actinomycetota bacterium]
MYDSIVRVKNGLINLSTGSFCRILPHLLGYLREGNNNKRLVASLIDSLPLILNEEELMKVKEDLGDEQQINFLINCFSLMRELFLRDEKRMTEFYGKAESLNLHRLIVSDYMLTDRMLVHSLPVLLKILQKSSANSSALDYMAISGLQRLKKLALHSNPDIVLELVQIVSHLARSKVDYYPNIVQMGIVEHLPRYLASSNDMVREKTLNLLGNLAKHNTQFFDDFVKYRVIAAISTTVNPKSGNH